MVDIEQAQHRPEICKCDMATYTYVEHGVLVCVRCGKPKWGT